MSKALTQLIDQLDLTAHINSLESYFSRYSSIHIEGDQELHFKYISALDKYEFKAPPKIAPFTTILAHLKKQGTLHFDQIFEILKLIRYFYYLQNQNFEGIILKWMEKIIIPELFQEIDAYFDEKGNFNESQDEEIYKLSERIKSLKSEIASSLKRQTSSKKLSSYLADTQIHYVNAEECLMLRGGFNHVLKGTIIGRSSGGFFYVVPESITKAKATIRIIENERETLYFEYAKKFSLQLQTTLPFLKFIDREFDKFDHYQARVLFAKGANLSIIDAKKSNNITLTDFSHPAIENAKPINVEFKHSVLMITGVNAGGKTMLLKSILSAAFMAKYLIPMKINATKSEIGRFKFIKAVIDDPQNVANDISTFAGRMQQFSNLFEHNNALIGVDEIELGTDSDEAAALFKVLLDELVSRGQKIVVTTHHKRLASLMANRDDVELMAAIFDEERRKPTYEFLQGTIGRSYAFETALRYGINAAMVEEAKKVYGENHEKLNSLIERGSQMERELKSKNEEIDTRLEAIKAQQAELKEERHNIALELQREKQRLQAEFDLAISKAKEAAKQSDLSAIHRKMNKANRNLPKHEEEKKFAPEHVFQVGEKVKYRKEHATILSLKKKEAMIEVDGGFKIRVKLYELKPSGNLPKKPQPKADVNLNVERRSGLKLDLHGMRAEEACEKLDQFISDALINGWDEVLVYHGIGTGKLAYAVKNFLIAHPSVKKFDDAPAHMGGFGAKVVSL